MHACMQACIHPCIHSAIHPYAAVIISWVHYYLGSLWVGCRYDICRHMSPRVWHMPLTLVHHQTIILTMTDCPAHAWCALVCTLPILSNLRGGVWDKRGMCLFLYVSDNVCFHIATWTNNVSRIGHIATWKNNVSQIGHIATWPHMHWEVWPGRPNVRRAYVPHMRRMRNHRQWTPRPDLIWPLTHSSAGSRPCTIKSWHGLRTLQTHEVFNTTTYRILLVLVHAVYNLSGKLNRFRPYCYLLCGIYFNICNPCKKIIMVCCPGLI